MLLIKKATANIIKRDTNVKTEEPIRTLVSFHKEGL